MGKLTIGNALLGANSADGLCTFRLWAPHAADVQLKIVHPEPKLLPMRRTARGYYEAQVPAAAAMRYFYRVNGQTDLPDPASRFQPEGVHGPSEVYPSSFPWDDAHWFGLPLRDYIIYELHIGTFTPEGTFDGAIKQLRRLKDLGITAIEIMPVAQFAGARNWGYDGVGLFAVQNSYGGPEGFKRLVNAAHQHGIAVILDVVYNHLGPEGNYLNHFGPYFTDTYRTPWGKAVNFDGAHSDDVRQFFLENALYWQTELHIDALRLDAVHAIRDISAVPFLRELSQATQARAEKLNRRFHLIAESDLNAPRFILPEAENGYGMHAQWADDFHHCLHVLVTGQKNGYYEDYTGGLEQFAKVWREGFAYTGEYSPYRKMHHGDSTHLNSFKQFVVCAQNHDQVGNRMLGERLAALTDFESLKLAAAAVLLSPFVPLLFMGEEYGERAPFQYFIDHTDEQLVEAVRKGRREEFASFGWRGEPPDPKDEHTFQHCKLNPRMAHEGASEKLLRFYRELIQVRRALPCFTTAERQQIAVRTDLGNQTLAVHYRVRGTPELFLLLAFGQTPVNCRELIPAGAWTRLLDSAEPKWGGAGVLSSTHLPADDFKLSGRSAVVYVKESPEPTLVDPSRI
jgi:maltooligosyltrehalose trehalohydrolase